MRRVILSVKGNSYMEFLLNIKLIFDVLLVEEIRISEPMIEPFKDGDKSIILSFETRSPKRAVTAIKNYNPDIIY